MTSIVRSRHRDRRLMVGLSATGILFIGIAAMLDRDLFRPYFGRLDPWVVASLVALVGAGALTWLDQQGRFRLVRRGDPVRRARVVVALALGFVAAAIAADVILGFPQDMNAPWPEAVPFYIGIGFVAEIVFHVVPLAAFTIVLRRILASAPAAPWAALGMAALVEPTFQVVLAADGSLPLQVFTALHLLAFNVTQLLLFRRYDFLTMFSLRLAYYACWHLAWGAARLELLF